MTRYSDGAWDCSHAYDATDHFEAWARLRCPTDPEAAINVVREAWGNEAAAREAWISANAEDVLSDSQGKRDPADEYVVWREAWQARAVTYTRDHMLVWGKPCDCCGYVSAGHTCCPP